jgi:hypothetical protein
MTTEDGLPDVISRVADNLPVSIAATELDDEDLAWEMMRQRDKYNLIYGRGVYSPPEPEPEEMESLEGFEEQRLNSLGMEVIMPGLEPCEGGELQTSENLLVDEVARRRYYPPQLC